MGGGGGVREEGQRVQETRRLAESTGAHTHSTIGSNLGSGLWRAQLAASLAVVLP